MEYRYDILVIKGQGNGWSIGMIYFLLVCFRAGQRGVPGEQVVSIGVLTACRELW